MSSQPIDKSDFYRGIFKRLVPLALFTAVLYTLLHLYTGLYVLVGAAAFFGLIYLVLNFTLKRNQVYFTQMRVIAAMGYVGFMLQILMTGGLTSSAIIHLLFILLIGLFYGKTKDLYVFLVITLLSLIVLFILFIYGLPAKNYISPEKLPIFNLANYFYAIITTLLLGFFFKFEITHSHRQLKSAYNELQDAYQKIEMQDKLASIGQMTAGVAHEINNPVNYMKMGALGVSKLINELNNMRRERDSSWLKIHGMTENATHETLAEINQIAAREVKRDFQEIFSDIREMVNSILVGADRTSEIVKSLKIFSRTGVEETSPVNLNECIDMAFVLLETDSSSKVKISKKLADLPKLQGNFTQLFQVMMNLISNAIDAIPEEGTVHVKTYMEGRNILCEVADTGMGIPDDKLNKIFQPFFTTKAVGKGTGLGLSITKKIIEDHGGNIEVRSLVGEGTTFIIKLPSLEAN